MTEIVLKPCPFCGSEDFLISEWKDFVSVKCGQCETKVGAQDEKTAIEYWNYRPIEDAKDEEIKQLKSENARLQKELNEAIEQNYKNAFDIQQQAERGAKYAQEENARLCEALEKVQK